MARPATKKSKPGDEKKQVEAAKKAIAGEVKKLAGKTKKRAQEAKELKQEKDDAKKGKPPKKKKNDKGGVPSPDGKARVKEIDLKLKDFEKYFQKEAGITSDRISRILQDYVPDDKAAVPTWQKGMDKWYRDLINKEPGWDIGGGVRANGDISIKDKKVKIDFSGKF